MMVEQDVRTGQSPPALDRCNRSNCFAPETACNLGSELSSCPFFVGAIHQRSEQTASHDAASSEGLESENSLRPALEQRELADGTPLPWTGNSFGTVDLEFLTARSNPRVVGLVGGQNAGKTTLLIVLYLLLHAGRSAVGRQFCGSFTLGGWEALAHHLRWSGTQSPVFPPHTPRGLRRMPGLLHLAFRRTSSADAVVPNSTFEDVLFTDPPGEWFGTWAINRDAPMAEGARWIATHSDAFVLLVDSEALAGPERGNAREQVLRLTQRLSECAQGKRVAVVWTKADIPVRESIRATIVAALDKDLPGHRSFSVQVPLNAPIESDPERRSPNISTHMEETFLDLLTWLLDAPRSLASNGFRMDIVSEVRSASESPRDPFLAYSNDL